MHLHTRVTVTGRTKAGSYSSANFGIPYEPDRGKARQHEKVKEAVDQMSKFYPLVEVRFDDTN